LSTAEKPESQEICFVPSGDYRDLLRQRLGDAHPALEEGDLVDRAGRILGRHAGHAAFTVGQRKGLGGGFSEPMFVLEIVPETRRVVLGTRAELRCDSLEVGELNWLTAPPAPGREVRVQLRYRSADLPAIVAGAEGLLELQLLEEASAVTPGQSAVVLEGERVLGGGRIVRAGRKAGAAR
jgi:tRNA-specific 2-thiouridylase